MFLKSLLLLPLVFSLTPKAFADRDSKLRGSVRINVDINMDQRVRELERTVRYMDQRIRNLEAITSPRPLPPPVQSSYTCMIVDSGYSKTFYGKGRTLIETEFETKQNCAKSVHSSYCQNITKCSTDQMDPYAKEYFCLVTDSGYGKTFKGEGSDQIEAEAKAKQACQSAVHPSYCGKVTAKCESIR